MNYKDVALSKATYDTLPSEKKLAHKINNLLPVELYMVKVVSNRTFDGSFDENKLDNVRKYNIDLILETVRHNKLLYMEAEDTQRPWLSGCEKPSGWATYSFLNRKLENYENKEFVYVKYNEDCTECYFLKRSELQEFINKGIAVLRPGSDGSREDEYYDIGSHRFPDNRKGFTNLITVITEIVWEMLEIHV